MNNILEISRPLNELNLKLKNDLDISRNNKDFVKIVSDVVKSGITYSMKALGDEKEEFGDFLKSIKNLFNKNEFKNMIECAVGASVGQGLENLKEKNSSLKDLNKFKEISIKGGLKFMVSAGFEILLNKLLKGNILTPIIKKAVSGIKDFLSSKSFSNNIGIGVEKLKNKVEKFKDYRSQWYNAYEKFDLNKLNEIAINLNKIKGHIPNDTICARENEIIQNMTKLINNKKEKLSDMQLQICGNL